MIIHFETKLALDDPILLQIDRFLTNAGVRYSTYTAPFTSGERTEIHLFSPVEGAAKAELSALVGARGAVLPHCSPFPRVGIQSNGEPFGFTYRGISFSQNDFHIFAGLCAVDSRASAAAMMHACAQAGLKCTRMGAYKPRTSPYSFAGLGKSCLPFLFEEAGRHGIEIIAMEVLSPQDIADIEEALSLAGNPCGVILQVGTRNTQNVSLLRAVGQQTQFPVLLKRGFGVSLHESLYAAEHIAAEGNCKIIFCLRGVKSVGAAPHRNLVDFGHIPTVKRLTRLSVCADPSHSAGSRAVGSDGLSDIHHASAQAVIAGSNMLLVDFHPNPEKALCDGHQALTTEQLPLFIEDMNLCRQTYLQRCALGAKRKVACQVD